METDFITPFHPILPPQPKIDYAKAPKVSITTIDEAEPTEQSKEQSLARKANVTPTQTVESRRYGDEALRRSLEAVSKAEQLDASLKKSGVHYQDVTSKDKIPNFLTDKEIAQFIEEDAKKIENAQAIHPVTKPLLEQAEAVQKSLESSTNALQSKAFATQSNLTAEKNAQALTKQSNVFLAAIDETLRGARNDEKLIKFHTDQEGRINTAVEDLLSLQQLAQKYATLNLEKVDLTKDGTTQETKQDFERMADLIQKSTQHGVLWKQPGWNSAKERDSYIKGVTEAATALQTKNKMNDIKLQQAYQNLAARLIFTTTLTKRHHDLITSIIHNMRNG